MMESFGKDLVQMYHGDGYTMLTDIVPHQSVDIAIVDNPFKREPIDKMWMYHAVGHALKDDGIMVVFDDQRGWDECNAAFEPYWHTMARFSLFKNRPQKKLGEAKSNVNIMNWLTPGMNEVVGSSQEWRIGYLYGEPMTAKSRINNIWSYNSSDKLGKAAGCKKLHRGVKGIGMAGFILKHLAASIERPEGDIVVADPYGGSGTFAIASQLLGMKCYSAEIDKVTFDNAKTKFLYAVDKAKTDRYWFKTSLKGFQDRVVG